MSIVTAFLLALVPLVVIHELGHFLMAKLGGIHVSQFCIGFGKRLFGFKYKGTDYAWNLLPFGGYVDLMGDLVYSGEIPTDKNHFYNRPKWIRFLVLIMGPMFNLVLAFGLYWIYNTLTPQQVGIYMGDPYTVGVVGEEAPEVKAGLQVGDRIVAYNGTPITDWKALEQEILLSPNAKMVLTVVRDGDQRDIEYIVQAEPTEGYGLQGFLPDQRVQVGAVTKDSPSDKAGILEGDKVVKINGEPVTLYAKRTFNDILKDQAPAASVFTIERGSETLTLEITPELKTVDKEEGDTEQRWLIGVSIGPEHTSRKLSIIEALPVAWKSLRDDSTMMYSALRKLVMGALPLKMLSGPVGMARAASQAFSLGIVTFIGFVGVLSLNLGIMNLLPIPVLDGGEIFVLLVEAVSRKEFSLDTKFRIKMVGFYFLVALMVFVLISDVLKFF